MPYNVPTVQINFGGALPGGEVWQCGFRATTNGATLLQPALQAVVNAVAPLLTTWWNSAAIGNYAAVGETLTRVQAYSYLPNNTTAAATAAASVTTTARIASQTVPNQVAVVASLRTATAGRTSRGRIYLPLLAVAMVGSQMQTATATGYATQTATLITGINGITDIENVIGGTSLSPVTAVVVDTIPDTQRRRRNKLVPIGTGTATV